MCNCRQNAYKKALYMLESEFPCKHCVDSFQIPEMERFIAEPHPQNPTFRELNDGEKQWKLGHKEVCSRIPFTEADMLMYQTLGRPEFQIILDTCHVMPKNPLSGNPKAMQGYMEMLFVHYCGHLIAKYDYSNEFIGSFIKYAQGMVLHKDPKIATPPNFHEREELLATYHAKNRTATEEELNSEYFESLEENNEFKNSHSGDITIEDDDLEDIYNTTINEEETEEPGEDVTQEGEEEDHDETTDERDEEYTTKNEVSDILNMLYTKTQDVKSVSELVYKIEGILEEVKKKI